MPELMSFGEEAAELRGAIIPLPASR